MKTPSRQPRKRDRDATHERLIEAASRIFNRDGFDGTDSNRLARAAGYAPGTFYLHFADKRACFLAVYERWVDAEWLELARALDGGGPPPELARRVVDVVLALHKKWRGLRGALRALVATDADVRRFQRGERKRQLGLLADLRRRHTPSAQRNRAEDTLLLLAMERTADALADGEAAALDLPESQLRAALYRLMLEHITPRAHA
jgi:AcrR family transcriptional regulator